MKILTVSTSRPDLRSEVWGWTCEDSTLVVTDKPIGYTSSPKGSTYTYPTVLHAIADGYRMIGPPIRDSRAIAAEYSWWLQRDY